MTRHVHGLAGSVNRLSRFWRLLFAIWHPFAQFWRSFSTLPPCRSGTAKHRTTLAQSRDQHPVFQNMTPNKSTKQDPKRGRSLKVLLSKKPQEKLGAIPGPNDRGISPGGATGEKRIGGIPEIGGIRAAITWFYRR